MRKSSVYDYETGKFALVVRQVYSGEEDYGVPGLIPFAVDAHPTNLELRKAKVQNGIRMSRKEIGQVNDSGDSA